LEHNRTGLGAHNQILPLGQLDNLQSICEELFSGKHTSLESTGAIRDFKLNATLNGKFNPRLLQVKVHPGTTVNSDYVYITLGARLLKYLLNLCRGFDRNQVIGVQDLSLLVCSLSTHVTTLVDVAIRLETEGQSRKLLHGSNVRLGRLGLGQVSQLAFFPQFGEVKTLELTHIGGLQLRAFSQEVVHDVSVAIVHGT
jgi:hypothetical protein